MPPPRTGRLHKQNAERILTTIPIIVSHARLHLEHARRDHFEHARHDYFSTFVFTCQNYYVNKLLRRTNSHLVNVVAF